MTGRARTGTQDRDTALFHFLCNDFPISLILISQSWVTCPPLTQSWRLTGQSWVTCPPLEHVGEVSLTLNHATWGRES